MARDSGTDGDFRSSLVQYIPDLRAFARFLSKDRDRADDLVQEAVLRALAAMHQYKPGTNMKSWLFTILRNQFYTELRKVGVPAVPLDEEILKSVTVTPAQEAHLEFGDFQKAFWQLSEEHREVLILVGASGLSYEDAAEVCSCAVGTIKSRLSRARTELNRRLNTQDG